MTQKKIEDKSLRMTILVNFIIVIAGIWIFSVTKIQALFLDCFFSIVSLISAIVGMILAGLSRKKTKRHPEGLYFLEPFYAIIESIIIFIVLGQSLFETGVSAYKYFVNGVGEAMNTTSVLPYTISMVILCFGIGYYNKMQNRKMNGISTMLETESKSNFIDGIQSLGIGVAILLLFIVKKDGMFGFLHYTGDFFITLCIVIFSIKEPFEILKQGFNELTGGIVIDENIRKEIGKEKFAINLDIFENASKYFLEKMTEFKEILSDKVNSLNNKDWILSKGSVKTCKADETGKKKRCKVGLKYGLKIELSVDDVDIIWNEFSSFFTKTYVENIERISNNEELGRYEFIAKNTLGDEVRCAIYLANEWNIAQICILGYVSGRYKKTDLE